MEFERIFVIITNKVKFPKNYNHWIKFGDFSNSLSTVYFSQILFVIGDTVLRNFLFVFAFRHHTVKNLF